MLKKEFNDISKQSLLFFAGVLLAAFFLYVGLRLLDSTLGFGDLFYPVYQLGLPVFGLFLGLSLFVKDSQDRGMEYLLTLPVSRLHLLWLKTFPRLIALMFCYGVYALLLAVGKNVDMQLLHLPGLLGISLSLFVIGQSFSTFRGNFIVAALGAMFTFTVFQAAIHLVHPLMEILKLGWSHRLSDLLQHNLWWDVPHTTYAAGFGILAAFITAFIHAFKQYHLGKSRDFSRRYLKVFVPITAVVLAISGIGSFGAIKNLWHQYHLTAGHQLLEYNLHSMRIYSGAGTYEPEGIPWTYPHIVEQNNDLYMNLYHRDHRHRSVVRLGLEKQKIEPLYTPAPGFTVGYKMYCFKETIAFFEWNRSIRGEQILVLLNTVTGEQKRKTFQVRPRSKRYNLRVFGAGEIAGERLWLVHNTSYHGYRSYGLWEKSGKIEDLGLSDIKPYYLNGRLVFARSGRIRISSVNSDGISEIKVLDINLDGKLVFDTGDGANLEYLPVTEVYGGIRDMETYTWKRHIKLDLESLELHDITGLKKDYGRFEYHRSGSWYYISREKVKPGKKTGFKLYRLRNGFPEFLKEFEFLELFYGGSDYFGIYPGGVLYKKNNKITIYNLPDMKEITIKGI